MHERRVKGESQQSGWCNAWIYIDIDSGPSLALLKTPCEGGRERVRQTTHIHPLSCTPAHAQSRPLVRKHRECRTNIATHDKQCRMGRGKCLEAGIKINVSKVWVKSVFYLLFYLLSLSSYKISHKYKRNSCLTQPGEIIIIITETLACLLLPCDLYVHCITEGHTLERAADRDVAHNKCITIRCFQKPKVNTHNASVINPIIKVFCCLLCNCNRLLFRRQQEPLQLFPHTNWVFVRTTFPCYKVCNELKYK